MEYMLNGTRIIIDKEDKHFLNEHHFYISNGYVRTNGYGLSESFHRIITDAPKGKHVDHINGNTLDNRKINLRICSTKENIRNCKMRKNNKSGFKGVYWDKKIKKWRANICVNRKTIYLGLYESPEKASIIYWEAAKKYFGEFARKY
jgi:hypothetical protein